MKKVLFIIGCVVLTFVGFQSCNQNHHQQISDDVRRVLDNNYPALSYNVNDEVVTLTGTVDSEQERISAENMVRSVNHVKSVVNNVSVVSASAAPTVVNRDESLRSTISSRLNNAGYRDIDIEVRNGEVILSGDLDRADLNDVMQIANEANPTRVTNRITLR